MGIKMADRGDQRGRRRDGPPARRDAARTRSTRRSPSTKAQRMIERDGVAVLMGEINSASALTITQVAARNKKLFMSIGARSDVLRGKNCNRYTFHVDIPVTVMVNAAGPGAAARQPGQGQEDLQPDRRLPVRPRPARKAAKNFFAANGGTQIGDELVATDVTDFSPYLLKIRQAQARPGRHQPGRQPGHQLRQAVRRVRPALPDRRLQPQHRRRLGGGRRQPRRHLADGLAPRPRHAGLEGLRRRVHRRSTASRPRTMPGSSTSRSR